MEELIENRLIELRKEQLHLTDKKYSWTRGFRVREQTILCENTINELEELLKKNIKL